ncbi:COP9 signalosome complex subunit 8-like [Ruditapes philippinarum]|uniref:COP9 signalosome complex subunit 8-like n=1 Tax=Ruditapes philippinarum TaxID=129788 RepID=UPI00295B52BD|nr:COP9 signalosome complex subunit 8-like [Ruditapes philippinarum]
METEQQITDYVALARDLENQELEAAGGVANTTVYGKLLCIYLLQNDTCNAKFLWKRIPQQVKTGCPELALLWAVGQKMWQRDFPGIYETIQKEWTDPYKDIMAAVLEATRRRAFNLVAQAYSSINAEEFAAYMGMPVNDAVKAAQNEGWQADPNTKLVTPRKPVAQSDPVLANEQQLSVLTDYVSFLES